MNGVDDEPPPRRWPWGLGFGLLGLVLGAGITFGAAEIATPNTNLVSARWQHAWDEIAPAAGDFVTSPGPAALAAVGAAMGAYRSVSRQLRAERRQARRDRFAELDDRREDRWWELYRMVEKSAGDLTEEGRRSALEALDRSMAEDDDLQDTFFIALSYRLEMGDSVPEDPDVEEGEQK